MFNKKEYILSVFIIILIIIPFLLIGCENESTSSTDDVYSASGIVKNKEGEGLEGVKVFIDNNNQEVAETKKDGSWEITNLTGAVTIKLVKEGYKFEEKVIEKENSSDIEIIGEKEVYILNIYTKGLGTVNGKDSDLKSEYEYNTELKLKSIADQGWRFDHWEGDLAGDETLKQLIINEEKTITAVFVKKNYPLNISVTGNGTVEEKVISSAANYEDGTEVQLTAVADQGWCFDRWEGDLQGEENPKKILVDSEKSITAVFIEETSQTTKEFILNVGDRGSVTVIEPDDNQVLVEANQSYSFSSKENEKIKLTANPINNKYSFKNWSGDISEDKESIELIVDSDIKANANFRGNVFKLINSWGSNWGPNSDGSLYITYDAAVNVNLNVWILGKKENYQTEALALFDIDGYDREDWNFTIQIPDRSSNNKKSFYPSNIQQKGGDEPFPSNKLALDITELMPFEGENIVLKVINNSSQTGNIESFEVEVNGHVYSANISDKSIESGQTKEITIEGITSQSISSNLLSTRDSLESVSRKINDSDIEKYFKNVNKNRSVKNIVDGYGTGWNTFTKKNWQLLQDKGYIKTINSEEVTANMEVLGGKLMGINEVDHSKSNYFPPVRSQGQEGACTAWSAGYYIKSFYEAEDHGWDLSSGDNNKIMSPEFIYHLINNGENIGTYYLDAIRLIEHNGVSTWSAMPYDDQDHTSWPSESAFKMAGDYRSTFYNGTIGYYLQINDSSDIEALQTILANGYLATIAVDSTQYDYLTENGVWTKDAYVSPNVDHANTIVGFLD